MSVSDIPPAKLAATAGIGLKPEHFRPVLEASAHGLWVEVHPETYMAEGGPRLNWLEAIRKDKPVSFHGVGMSLGGAEPLDLLDTSELNFRRIIFLSQLAQSLCIKTFVEELRRVIRSIENLAWESS